MGKQGPFTTEAQLKQSKQKEPCFIGAFLGLVLESTGDQINFIAAKEKMTFKFQKQRLRSMPNK